MDGEEKGKRSEGIANGDTGEREREREGRRGREGGRRVASS